jgi:hypothetical protein
MQPVKLIPQDVRPPRVASASVKAARLSLARSQSALFPTRLALARWTGGGNVPHLHDSGHPPLRAAFFARAQRDFQAWLDDGGFAQHDDAASSAVETLSVSG